jgi:hypothetical protein
MHAVQEEFNLTNRRHAPRREGVHVAPNLLIGPAPRYVIFVFSHWSTSARPAPNISSRPTRVGKKKKRLGATTTTPPLGATTTATAASGAPRPPPPPLPLLPPPPLPPPPPSPSLPCGSMAAGNGAACRRRDGTGEARWPPPSPQSSVRPPRCLLLQGWLRSSSGRNPSYHAGQTLNSGMLSVSFSLPFPKLPLVTVGILAPLPSSL